MSIMDYYIVDYEMPFHLHVTHKKNHNEKHLKVQNEGLKFQF